MGPTNSENGIKNGKKTEGEGVELRGVGYDVKSVKNQLIFS